MIDAGGVFLGGSLFGLSGATFLCPLLARSFRSFSNRHPAQAFSIPAPLPTVIDIVIPAHNEAERLPATLRSIRQAMEALEASGLCPNARVGISVGADHCSDQTVFLARQWEGVVVTECPEHRSKWLTLKALCAKSHADWIVFVDAGTLWPERFLIEVVQRMDAPGVIGISPAYQSSKSGFLHKAVWRLEKTLKRFEMAADGPVTVHGATVCYKAGPLKNALLYLGDTLWLNDDVVIPLILRSLYPRGILLYPIGQVEDMENGSTHFAYARRKRIVTGNLQWMSALLPACFRLNPVAGLLALRRVFRLFWGYWAAFAGLSLAIALHQMIPTLVILGLLMVLGSVRELAGAALVSLLAPFRLARFELSSSGNWK